MRRALCYVPNSCVWLLTLCLVSSCGSGSGGDPGTVDCPTEGYRNFTAEYIQQGDYDAFPGPFDATWVANRFAPCSTCVDFEQTAFDLPEEMVEYDPDKMIEYLKQNAELRYWSLPDDTVCSYSYHLLAIKCFCDKYGNKLSDIDGGAIFPGYPSAFICIGLIEEKYQSKRNEATAHTVIHELGHARGELTDLCDSYDNHDLSVTYPCVMSKLCWNGKKVYPCCSPDDNWEMCYEFCDKCKQNIKNLGLGHYKY